MAKELTSDTNRDQIQLYLVSDEGTVTLTDAQKTLLKRWEYADELIRQKEIRKRETQAQMIMRLFGVSRTTAYQDIVNAEAVFASSTPLNKKYRIQARIEFLEQKIDEIYNNLEPDSAADPDEDFMARLARINQNREYLSQAAQLEKVLQKYYDIYPEITPPRSPKKIVFNIQNNNMPAAPMSAEDAMNQAAKMIQIKPNDGAPGAGI